METSRDDFSIAIRSAFLRKETQQRFSIFALVVLSLTLLLFEKFEVKPINYFRSFVQDVIYRGSIFVSYPSKGIGSTIGFVKNHINLYKNYDDLKKENTSLKKNIFNSDYLKLENTQLRRLIDEQELSITKLISARVLLDKESPYLNSFVINLGGNKKIKNGMAVLDGSNFIGRIVDVNFFSSRVLLISDLNSKIPVVTEPAGHHAILSGKGKNDAALEYLPENHNIKNGDKVYTSGKEGIFSPGIPIGEIKIKDKKNVLVSLFSDLNQVTFVNINLEEINSK